MFYTTLETLRIFKSRSEKYPERNYGTKEERSKVKWDARPVCHAGTPVLLLTASHRACKMRKEQGQCSGRGDQKALEEERFV